jgi:hypothetical protein
MARKRNPTESEHEYRQREIRDFIRHLQDLQKDPGRKDGYKDLKELLLDERQHRYLIEDVFGWMLNGSYGAGAYYWFWGLQAKPRTKVIMGFIIACQLNFMTSEYYVRKAIKETIVDLEEFNKRLIAEMVEQSKEQGV